MLYFNLTSLFLIAAGATVLGSQTGEIAGAARVYPSVLIALVILCSAIIAIKEVAGRASTPPLNKELSAILRAPSPVQGRLVAFAATWVAYPWALSTFGFLVATTVALSVSLWVLRIGRPMVGVAAAAVFSLGFAILFATVLYIPTPSGPLDEWLAQQLYAIQ